MPFLVIWLYVHAVAHTHILRIRSCLRCCCEAIIAAEMYTSSDDFMRTRARGKIGVTNYSRRWHGTAEAETYTRERPLELRRKYEE
jgi:hypothetical protein